MRVAINIGNEQMAFLAVSTVIVFTLLGMVGAYNEPPGSGVPSIMGHSVDEMNLSPLYIVWATGRVGIGTTSPRVPLEVSISAVSGNLQYWGVSGAFVGAYMDASTFRLRWGNDNTKSLVLTSVGRVGIGTASPTLPFHIHQSGSTGFRMKFSNTDTGTVGDSDGFDIGIDDNENAVIWNRDGAMRIGADNAEVIRITGGNVGIGTTSPQDVTSNSDLTITGTIAQDSWTAPTLTNGWVNYAPNYNPAGYFRDKNGIVHLRGMVRSGTIGQAIFTLPAGYRPEYRELHAVQTSLNTIGRCDITTGGEVLAQSGSNAWFSLDGITFRASGY